MVKFIADLRSKRMTTITVEVKKADPKLKKLLSQVAEGKEVLFKEGDQLVARLVPVGKRVPGLHAGTIKISKDFNDPLPDEFWADQ
jgi:antitoxin (DNA-binding transcriptional repressor) of toxin-antitoxin stability system